MNQRLLYVDPKGRDTNSGLRPEATDGSGPVATLERARDTIRQWKQRGEYPDGGVGVNLAAGLHFRATAFDLTARDSGREGAPVVYRAVSPGAARLVGGRCLTGFRRVEDPAILNRLAPETRGRVMQVDLRALGITDYGTYQPRGHGGGSANAALELFFNGEVMTVARWPKRSPLPNHGYAPVADAREGRLVYEGDRPSRWASHADVFLHGYFSLDWASTIARAVSIDTGRREITLDPPAGGHYGIRKGGRFFFFNILEELSDPGEWYVDRATGILYFLPPSPVAEGESLVSMLEEPLIRGLDVEHVRFEGLALECTRGDAVSLQNGAGVVLAGCRLVNVGRTGVRIRGGFGHQVQSCDITQTGEAGVVIEHAGDRRNGIPCRHAVDNCHIHHIAREGWTYFECVHLMNTCGAIIRHNRFHDHRHALICYRGNDHVIEFNELYNFTLEGDDCGCLYYGRDFTLQGHVVRYNYLHHAGDSGRNDWGSSGVYMDDGAGGTEVHGNVFHYVNKGVLAGGGVNTRIRNNVFVNCQPAIWFDERLASAQADRGDTMMHGWMRDRFYELYAHQPPFAARYPCMDVIHDALQRGMGVKALNASVRRNIVVGAETRWLCTHWATFPDYFDNGQNSVNEDPGFVDPAFGNFQVRQDSRVAASIGFERIPMEKIGLYRDAYRGQLESVWSSIEILKPAGQHGEPGRARLRLRNDGDVPVEGVERVEIKARHHGKGFDAVSIPYRVEPGTVSDTEFDVAVAPEELQGKYELFLFSRGERVRPAWSVMPVACRMTTRLEVLEPVVFGSARPGRVRLTVQNTSAEAVEETVTLQVTPEAGVRFPVPPVWRQRLAAGAEAVTTFAVELAPSADTLVSRIYVSTHGTDVRPAQVEAIVEYPLAGLPQDVSLAELERAMAPVSVLPVNGVPHLAMKGHFADVRVAVAGDRLAVCGEVRDDKIEVTPLLWDGSCIELFGASPDLERIGHVFPNLKIGQVYLVPACNGKPARAYRFKDNEAQEIASVAVATEPVAGGYRFRALVPLAELEVDAGMDRFLFEAQVTTNRHDPVHKYLAGRCNLFGSRSAFNDTRSYALMRR